MPGSAQSTAASNQDNGGARPKTGKKNKKSGKGGANKQPNGAAAQNGTEESKTEQELEAEYSTKTPEERAAAYAQQQLEMYQNFLDSFKEDQIAIELPMDFTDKQAELENKFKKEETKKLEKILKKDVNEWEDSSNAPGLRQSENGLNTLAEKLGKIMKDSVGKALKRHSQAIGKREQ